MSGLRMVLVLSRKVMNTAMRMYVTPLCAILAGQLEAAVRTTFGETLKPDPTQRYSTPVGE